MKPGVLVCAPWGKQLLPSVKVSCSECGVDLALSDNNVELSRQHQLSPICFACLGPGDHVISGFACAGALYSRPDEALRAFNLFQRRN